MFPCPFVKSSDFISSFVDHDIKIDFRQDSFFPHFSTITNQPVCFNSALTHVVQPACYINTSNIKKLRLIKKNHNAYKKIEVKDIMNCRLLLLSAKGLIQCLCRLTHSCLEWYCLLIGLNSLSSYSSHLISWYITGSNIL
jgi:hypothetical protein